MTSALDDLNSNPKTWDDAIGALRNSVKWTVGAFAAVAAALFGTGLITRPELSWDSNKWQIIIAAASGLAAVAAIVFLVTQVAGVFAPIVVSLRKPGPEVMALFNEDPKAYFGASATHAAPYAQVAFASLQRSGREKKYSAAAFALANDPGNATKKKALAVEEGLLNGARAYELEFIRGAAEVLDEARYYAVKETRGLKGSAVIAGGFAIFAGIAFQLILSTPKEADKPAATSAPDVPPASIATLTQKAGSDGSFWSAVGLNNCSVAPTTSAAASARVLVLSGAGTAADPYVVRTIPATAATPSACKVKEFSVIDDVAAIVAVDAPQKVAVSYSVVATTSVVTTITTGK